MTEIRKLRVFPSTSPTAPLRASLCHASQDKPVAPFGDDIRELYQRLLAAPYGDNKGWIDPWLDGEKLI